MPTGENFSLSKILAEGSMHWTVTGKVQPMLTWARGVDSKSKGFSEAQALIGVIRLYATRFEGDVFLAEGHIDRFCKHVLYVGKSRGGMSEAETDLVDGLFAPPARMLTGPEIAAIREAALLDGGA